MATYNLDSIGSDNVIFAWRRKSFSWTNYDLLSGKSWAISEALINFSTMCYTYKITANESIRLLFACPLLVY